MWGTGIVRLHLMSIAACAGIGMQSIRRSMLNTNGSAAKSAAVRTSEAEQGSI